MDIIFKTFSPEAPASKFYFDALSTFNKFNISESSDYLKADYVFFMTYQKDLEELKKVKTQYPQIKAALIDPRGEMVRDYIQYCDFLVIDSIEMYDYFAQYSIPIYTYHEYPMFNARQKKHTKKDKIILGYHGNKVHLTAMYPKITSAIISLSKHYNIEFWAIYDVNTLGKWDIGAPKNVKIKHIQWHPDVYATTMKDIDIGLIPACMPIKKVLKVNKFFLDSPEDYVIKFKMPSNPGRMAVFAKLGIPVVADFLPSHIQFIDHGTSGFLAETTGGWLNALQKLIESHDLRNSISSEMHLTYKSKFNFETQNINFYDWLEKFTSTQPAASKIGFIDPELHTTPRDNFLFKYANAHNLFKKIKKVLKLS